MVVAEAVIEPRRVAAAIVVAVRTAVISGAVVIARIVAAVVPAEADVAVAVAMPAVAVSQGHARHADADAVMGAGERGRRQADCGRGEQAEDHRTETTFAKCHDTLRSQFATPPSQGHPEAQALNRD